MTFDNGKTIISLRLRVLIITIFLLLYIYLAYFGKDIKFPVAGIGSSGWTLIVLSIYAFITFYPALFRYRYILFSDDGPVIILRYYSVGLIQGKKHSIEIPKKEFAGYTLKRYSLFFKTLILKRRIDRRTASYPPIPLAALKRKEIDNMLNSLKRINTAT